MFIKYHKNEGHKLKIYIMNKIELYKLKKLTANNRLCYILTLLLRMLSASGGKVIRDGIHIYIYVCGRKKLESYFSDQLTFSNIRSRTSR